MDRSCIFEKVCTHGNLVFAKLLLDKRVCSARVNAGGRSILHYILAGLAANENLSDGQSERAKSYNVDALTWLCDPNELEHGVITPSDHLMANCGSDEGVVSAFRFWTQALRDLGYELRSVTAPCETIATYVVVVSSTPHILPISELTFNSGCVSEKITPARSGALRSEDLALAHITSGLQLRFLILLMVANSGGMYVWTRTV